MSVFDVNTDASIEFSAKLERLHKSAFPSAIRNTLNDAAFLTKKHIPFEASKVFTTRNKTFFKRFSTIDKASGFNINAMASTVGMNSALGRKIASNLEAQEHGGLVKGRFLIGHNEARASKSPNKLVSKKNQHNKVKFHNASKAFKSHRGTKSSKFVAAVMSTAKSGKKHMMIKDSTGKGMVYEISGLSSNKKGKIKFKAKKLYSVRPVKNHTVKKHPFMRNSAKLASKQLDNFYKKNAEFQIKKYLR